MSNSQKSSVPDPKCKFVLLCLILFALAACRSAVPEKSARDYGPAVSAFYVGLAALQVGDDQRAKAELEKASNLAAGEPAVWNNLGVLQLRQKDFENAVKSLASANRLDPDNPLVYSNLAALETQRGNFDKTVEYLNKTIELDPKDVRALYALALEKERSAQESEALQHYRRIASEKPENLAIQLDIARLSAKLNDAAALGHAISRLEEHSREWPAEITQQFDGFKKAVAIDPGQNAVQVILLRNVLLGLPEFRAGISEIRPSDTAVGTLMLKPVKLPVPDFSPPEPDHALTFSAQFGENARALFAQAFFPTGEDPPAVIWADEKEIHVGATAVLPAAVSNAQQIAAFDFDFDFRNDLAAATERGFRLFRQTDGGKFEDATAATKLPGDFLQQPFSGVWTLDIESDGDLDLVLSRRNGSPVFLQNNGDASFKDIETFSGTGTMRGFVSADLDEDGDPDAVFADKQGKIQFYSNERGGIFAGKDLHGALADVAAIAAGDVKGFSRIDLIAVQRSGLVIRIHSQNGTLGPPETIGQIEAERCAEDCNVSIADLDNNGANDILISGAQETEILLGGKDGKFVPAASRPAARISAVAEMNGDGKPDLIGIGSDGRPAVFNNKGGKGYHWQVIRPKAAKTVGDQRINSFGIGGEMEIRSGLLAQKQLIGSPQVHFGLGSAVQADVLRVIWANGFVQAEFDLKSDQTVAAEQRLKGSCPHLFAWNGEKFELVKDAPPWSPALGLKINAQDTYGILQTEEWFKIPGAALKPKDGSYELRITGEYWESFYIDSYRLLAVDHPENTEVFTDERFAVPLPPLEVATTGQTQQFASARNDNGEDVSEIVAELDEKYLDGITRGKFQGVAADHFVELELPRDAPRDAKILLAADGWVHPTDASINVQRGQSESKPPKSLSVEIEDGLGGWKTVRDNLGFPAGKMKTVLIDLSGIFANGESVRRFRLKTEMEIFWDKLAWAVDLPENKNITLPLDPAEASLRYRGFSVIEKRDDSSPEKPVYDKILTTGQRWRDLEGFYTRFGDVLELIKKTDDRFVLINAGDEIILKFPALPDVASGWKRDFVIIGNGWIKDGDLNSVFSKTLLPLPTHATNDYSRRPGRLEDDPVFRRNRADWATFHTRYVAPDDFRNALRGR